MIPIIRQLEKDGRYGTAHVYRSTLRSFTAYWNKQKEPQGPMSLRLVFRIAILRSFEQYLKSKILKMNTISTYLWMLRAVYHPCVARTKSPFYFRSVCPSLCWYSFQRETCSFSWRYGTHPFIFAGR